MGLVATHQFGLIAAMAVSPMKKKMKTFVNMLQKPLLLSMEIVALLSFVLAQTLVAEDNQDKIPLEIKLPAPAFKGTPKDIQLSSFVEPLSDKPRPAMMVPAGLKNLSPGSKLSSSDTNATSETLAKLTDGDKEASDQSIILLRKGVQYVQMDLGNPSELYAIVIWHAHNSPKVYHSVVVQAADDAGFTQNVRTLFNNDQENKAKLGAGTEREYFETNEGKLIDAKGVKAQYLRFYSKGSTESALNEYTEIEAYGRPAK
jgi:hypothetical protein